jgi:hypothetical protein
MDEDADIRAFLASADTPPSRVDLTTVVADGDRQVRRRWYIAAAGTTTAVLAGLVAVPAALATVRGEPHHPPFAASPAPSASPSPSSAPQAVPSTSTSAGERRTCAARSLKLPPGIKRAKATAVDPTGRYIGGQEDANRSRGILWTDGKPTILPINEDWVEVDAINEHGVATGIAEDNAGKVEYVFRYAGGKVTKLTNVAGYTHVFARPAINAAGDIVINAETAGSVEGADSIAMIWKAGTTQALRIPLPVADNVEAITDDGTLVGTHYVNSHAVSAKAWTQSGQETKLDAPAGTVAAGYAARGDWATGGLWYSGKSDGLAGTPLWNLRTGKVAVIVGDVAKAVNSSGLVLSGDDLLTRDGPMPPQLPTPPNGKNVGAALSDTGLVVGSVIVGDLSNAMSWAC